MLDTESAKTLVHAFISSRVDGCNAVLAGSPKAATDRLQRVLNAAARVVSGTHKFDRGLTHLLHFELHWLDVPRRIQFKLGVTVHRCLQGNAPQYLVDCCKSTMPAALLCKSTPAHRAPSPSLQFRPSGVFCCRPDGLELASRFFT